MLARVNNVEIKFHGQVVEYYPNKMNRYQVFIRFQGSEKEYTINHRSIERISDEQVISEWNRIDVEMLNQKNKTP